jgi:hypothetical protein
MMVANAGRRCFIIFLHNYRFNRATISGRGVKILELVNIVLPNNMHCYVPGVILIQDKMIKMIDGKFGYPETKACWPDPDTNPRPNNQW